MDDGNSRASEQASQLLRASDNRGRRSRAGLTIVIVLAAIALVAASAALLQRKESSQAEDVATPRNATESYGFRLTPALATGTDVAEPPVTVALYEDFLCPTCGQFEEQSGPFLREAVASGRIVIEYRPFTFLLSASTNEYAQRAANAAVCVADEAGVAAYATMHDLLYAEQPAEGGAGPEDDRLVELAREAGAPDAGDCIRDRTFDAWVEAALAEGRQAGVSSTPTVVVNGQVLTIVNDDGRPVAPSTADLEQALEALGG